MNYFDSAHALADVYKEKANIAIHLMKKGELAKADRYIQATYAISQAAQRALPHDHFEFFCNEVQPYSKHLFQVKDRR